MHLSHDTIEVIEGYDSFLQKKILPLEERHRDLLHDPFRLYERTTGRHSDDARAVFREVRELSAEAGYYALGAPESVGGGAASSELYFAIWRHIHRRYGPVALLPHETVAHWTSGPSFLLEEMTDELKQTALEPVMSGTKTGAFAMSEPDAGSDAWAMTTRAVQDGDEWVINGTKQWITNSPTADHVFVFAVTDEDARTARSGGISCFYVPADTPGFAVDSVIKLFGEVGGNESILSFSDVRVPANALVGTLGRGFDLALRGVNLGRLYNAGRCIGLAEWAIALAADYAKQRRTFGRPLAEHQGISFSIADSTIDVYAGLSMARDCIDLLDAGRPAHTQMSMLKAYTTEMCHRVYDRAMQLHGGMGLTNEVGLYAGWHASRVVRIADGSTEIMRRNVLQDVLRGKYVI